MHTTLVALPEVIARRWPTAKPVALMARCPSCKAARRVERFAITTTGDWGRRVRWVLDTNGSRYFEIRCACGTAMHWQELKATTVETHRCDARCTNAVGPSCDCSCGGKNHGVGHS